MTDQFFAFYDIKRKRTVYGLGTATEANRWRAILEQTKGPHRLTPIPDRIAEEHHLEDKAGAFSLRDVLDEQEAD